MVCFVGLLDMEHHLGRQFHHHSVVYLNQSQYTLASAGRLSTPFFMRNMPILPICVETKLLECEDCYLEM